MTALQIKDIAMKYIDILVVDDEAHIVRALSFIFKKEGYQIETASDGEEALIKFRQLKPKIVFLDMIMPKKCGVDVCREIKSEQTDRPPHVILLTCKGQDIDRLNCFEAGADEFINKPFSPKEVLERVKALLGE